MKALILILCSLFSLLVSAEEMDDFFRLTNEAKQLLEDDQMLDKLESYDSEPDDSWIIKTHSSLRSREVETASSNNEAPQHDCVSDLQIFVDEAFERDQSQLHCAMALNQQAMFAIYRNYLERANSTAKQGLVVVSLEIEPSGDVSNAAIEDSAIVDQKFITGLKQVINSIRFPQQNVRRWQGQYHLKFSDNSL